MTSQPRRFQTSTKSNGTVLVGAFEQLRGLSPFEVGRVAADQRVDVGRQDRRRLDGWGEDDLDVDAGREVAL